MKTVRRRNMVNREMKLAIGEELQTLFHPIVSATKQAAEKTAAELAPKALEDMDGTLKAQQRTIVRLPPPSPPSPPQMDLTFVIHATGDGRNAVGNSIMHIEGNIDDKGYELTLGLRMLILYQKPRPQHYTSDVYFVYKAIVAQIRTRAYPNKRTGSARPRGNGGMAIPGDSAEE